VKIDLSFNQISKTNIIAQKKAMIYINALRKIIDPVDKSLTRPIFEIKFVKKSTGAIATGKVVCTSTNWTKDLVTIKFIESGEIRTIHALQIIQFNNEEVMV
jgi:hypothetical protein